MGYLTIDKGDFLIFTIVTSHPNNGLSIFVTLIPTVDLEASRNRLHFQKQ